LIVFGHQEVMSWNFYLGTVVILGAVIAYPFVKSRLKSKPFSHPSS
jgi:hypothetical protein